LAYDHTVEDESYDQSRAYVYNIAEGYVYYVETRIALPTIV